MELAEILAGPPELAAPELLGRFLSAHGVTIRLTEVEAYSGTAGDPASHAYKGRTARNASMFGPPGTLYVYFSYGMHWCVNISCGPVGVAAAVLLRAGEVVGGLDIARGGRAVADRDLARGPARLARVLALDRTADGTSLLDGRGPLTVVPASAVGSSSVGDEGNRGRGTAAIDSTKPAVVRSGPRVGVSRGADWPWRFWLDGEPTVSPYRRSPRAAPVGDDASRE